VLSLLDLKNYIFRNLANRISDTEIYKKSYSKFFITKSNKNCDLLKACDAFESQYKEKSANGLLVNDLRVHKQNGIHITVKKMDQTTYETINLATNSYNDLDLEIQPRNQLVEYVQNESLSSCLSRKIAGQLPIHSALEKEICDFLGYDSAILATCGYIAQQAVMFGLFHEGDVIFSDEHNHSSLIDGMRLTKAKVVVYPHLDYNALEKLIQQYRSQYNCAGIVSDGVFSAHGTMADLDVIEKLKVEYNLISIIDDTHGFATIGNQKRGVLDYFKSKPDVLTSSLAKGLAGFGGVIVGQKSIIRAIDCFGRQNINTSHLSPLVAAQSYFNLKFLRENLAQMATELNSKLIHFNCELDKLGIRQYKNHDKFIHPIFSFYAETEIEGFNAYQKLLENGFTGALFPPPVSPKPTIRLSLHRKIDTESLSRLAVLIKECNLKPLSQNYWEKIQHIQPDNKSVGQNISELDASILATM